MAINTTVSNFKGFTFDNFNSKNYGVYITGEAAYNAPLRDVEMISIPGRNGAFALDHGRFDNIEVTYHASMVADNETDFVNAISNFRNAICSKVGYCKLTDDYNAGEYRMAVYKSGLDVTPKMLRTGEFDIVFDCKPQRWLTSGETISTIANNGTISNPTLFGAKPLLYVKGYGDIVMNGYTISVANAMLGNVILLEPFGGNPSYSKAYASGLVNNGDDITVASGSNIFIQLKAASGYELIDVMVSNTSGVFSVTHSRSDTSITMTVTFPAENFTAGTDKTVSGNFTLTVSYRYGAGPEVFSTTTFTPKIEYTQTNRRFGISCAYDSLPAYINGQFYRLSSCNQISANSTISALGNPSYIDCEIGEAYKIPNPGEVVSINNAVTIGATLPELAPGSNTITYPNTVTELKIKPRWWKV